MGELRCKRAFARAKQGRAAEAATEIDDVLAGLRSDDYGAVGCLQLRGLVATGSGDAAGALRFASGALSSFDASGRSNAHDRAQLTVDLAYAHSQNGQPALADARFREARDAFERLGCSESAFAVSLHASWGVALADAGQPRAALEQFERASLIAARRAPDGEVPLALNGNRGNVLRWLGRHEQALDAHQRALAQARRDGNPSALMQSLAGTAIDLLRLQRVDDAEVLLNEGGALLQQGNHPPAGSAVMSLRNATATLWRAQSAGAKPTTRWRRCRPSTSSVARAARIGRCAGGSLQDRADRAPQRRRTATGRAGAGNGRGQPRRPAAVGLERRGLASRWRGRATRRGKQMRRATPARKRYGISPPRWTIRTRALADARTLAAMLG